MKSMTYKEVLSRISDLTDLIDVSALAPRLKRLIYSAASKSASPLTLEVKTAVVTINNGIGELPCDLLRLLRAYPDKKSYSGNNMEPYDLNLTGYQSDGNYIRPGWIRKGSIIIDYYAMPTIEVSDGNGGTCLEVKIHEQQMDYCAYYAIAVILRDELARNKISPLVYQLFQEDADGQFYVAKGNARMMSIDQFESMHWMNRNAQFFNAK